MTSILVIFSLTCLVSAVTGRSGLSVAYQWKFIDWTVPNVALTRKPFIIGNSFTQDVDIDASGRIFVTTPQWLDGVPITLSLVTDTNGPGGALLTPYPDWSWHTSEDCSKLFSVYRMAIDECNRLWIVDVGRIGSERVCPVKIMIFDLSTDQLIRKYFVPDDQAWNGTSLVTPIVEIGQTCNDAYLYVADVAEYGVLTYDFRNDISWRLNNTRGNAFGPDPDGMQMTIAGESFNLTDGTLGMSLSPKGFFHNRYLFFNSLSSFHEKVTSANALKQSWINREPEIYESILKRPSQAGVQATSRTGAIFFHLQEQTAVACWNIENPFDPEYIAVIAQDEEALQYMSGIKVIVNNLVQEELWFNTNRLQKIINKTLKPTEVNFRLMYGLVDDLIKNTICESRGIAGPYPDVSSWKRI